MPERKIDQCALLPSILAADLLNLASEIQAVEAAGISGHHFDVMDGHYVENLSFGVPILAAMKKTALLPIDVHIMVSNPLHVASWYLDAGADSLNFHIETCLQPAKVISLIKERKKKVGLAVHPKVPVESVFPYLEQVDQILMMSVVPGFGGQKILDGVTDRISVLYKELTHRNLHEKVMIAVDGGVNETNIKALALSGASIFIAGSAIYGHLDRKKAVFALQKA